MLSSQTTSAACLLLLFALGSGQQLKGINQEDPCKTKSRVVADATYCDRYWECQDGQPELYDCPNGLVFAGKNRGVTEGCDYPWRANYCEGKTQANGPIGREHCDWLYGIFGHETSCTRYWTCWNGTATEQLCIGGLLYNENTHSCDWPENVDGCQKHPLCNDDANGNVPLGKSCNRYWQCQGGYPRLQRCPAMLVFDKRSLRCVVPPTEDCEVPTTLPPPQQPLEEEEGDNLPPSRPQTRPNRPQSQRPQQFQPSQAASAPRPQQFQPSQQRALDDIPLPPGAVPIPLGTGPGTDPLLIFHPFHFEYNNPTAQSELFWVPVLFRYFSAIIFFLVLRLCLAVITS